MLLFIVCTCGMVDRSRCVSIHLMLLFISVCTDVTNSWSCVSIHLMLLFIPKVGQYTYGQCCFNTSHVTLYRIRDYMKMKQSSCFNTSHVTLYHKLFIQMLAYKWFQYISCYSLSKIKISFDGRLWVSIHLMLLFIQCVSDNNLNTDTFQYISCYSLSYLFGVWFLAWIWFQYISCYSLSLAPATLVPSVVVSIHLMLLFIQDLSFFLTFSYRFNTSHVTLYLIWNNYRNVLKMCFNTSHVTLYPI